MTFLSSSEETPDPVSILLRAKEDFLEKRYAEALAKHLWFHRHAVKVNPGCAGVRLSFALTDWHNLGQLYPPALKALEEARDEAAEKVRRGEDLFQSFRDAEAINHTRWKDPSTVELFEVLHVQNPEGARRVFGVARRALIKAKAFERCGQYIQPSKDLEIAIWHFRRNNDPRMTSRFGSHHLKWAQQSFIHETATLVALLAINERSGEAIAISEEAKAEWDNVLLHSRLDEALTGVLPPPEY